MNKLDSKNSEGSDLLKYQRLQNWRPVLRVILDSIECACQDVIIENDNPLDLEIRLKIDRAEMKGVVMTSSFKRKYAQTLCGHGFPFLMQLKI